MPRKKSPWVDFNVELIQLLEDLGIKREDRQKLQALKQWSKRLLECAYWCQPQSIWPEERSAAENLAEDYFIISENLDKYAHGKI